MRYLSMSQLSQVTGKDRRTVKDRLANLEARVEGRSHLYDAHVALPLILGIGSNDESIAKRMADEELRLKREQADKVALQNEKAREEVVAVADIAAAVEGEYAAVKASLLSIPYKCAGELAVMDSVIEIKKLLDGLLNEALSELSAEVKPDTGEQADPDSEEEN